MTEAKMAVNNAVEEQKHVASEELRRAEQVFSPFNWVHGELKDIRQEIGSLRLEMKQEIGSLRLEIKSVEESLRQKIESVEGSLRQEIKSLEGALRQKIESVESSLRQEIKLGGVRTLIWATFALIAGTLGVVVAMATGMI